MSQAEEIVQYMKTYGSITSQDAFADLGCTRLSARIFDIEDKLGLRVDRKQECSINRRGKKVWYTRYWLARGEK